MIGFAFSATVQTSNGVSPWRLPVTEKTSNGPQKSSTSAPSKRTIQIRRV
jgi:hypothetical protein